MNTPYFDYLRESGRLTEEQAARYRHVHPSAETWIGRLMVSHGLINMEQVNMILHRQDISGGLFGENAVALGLVTASHRDILLVAQELRRNVELLERLALSGDLPFAEGLAALREFYAEQDARCSGAAATC
ncbi:MAG: hypothetical protein V3T70_11075 [Phycisphaerae bacterium]